VISTSFRVDINKFSLKCSQTDKKYNKRKVNIYKREVWKVYKMAHGLNRRFMRVGRRKLSLVQLILIAIILYFLFKILYFLLGILLPLVWTLFLIVALVVLLKVVLELI
jgi:hypothetical protein